MAFNYKTTTDKNLLTERGRKLFNLLSSRGYIVNTSFGKKVSRIEIADLLDKYLTKNNL